MHLSRRAALAGALASTAMSPDQRMAVLGGASGPSLSVDFLSGALDSRVTFTRASSAWYFDVTGTLQSAATNTPRFDYGLAGGTPLGLLIEEQRTNSIRNNSMTGAVIGTPGTGPTNWGNSLIGGGTTTVQISSIASVSNIPAIRYVYGGTPTATSGTMLFETTSQIAASVAQVWTGSCYFQLNSGSLSTGFSAFQLSIREYDSGAVFLRQTAVSIAAATSTMARYSVTATSGASTAFVTLCARATTTGAAIACDFTIGAPQLELGQYATSPILTTSAAVIRRADVTSIPLVTASSFSVAVEAEVDAPATYAQSQIAAQINDGSANNAVALLRSTAGNATVTMTAASSSIVNTSLGAITQGAIYKIAAAHQDNLSRMATNAGAVTTSTAAGVIAPSTTLQLGCSSSGFSTLNGHLRRARYWPRLLSSGELQGATA